MTLSSRERNQAIHKITRPMTLSSQERNQIIHGNTGQKIILKEGKPYYG